MHKTEWTHCFVCLWHFQRWADQELPELMNDLSHWRVPNMLPLLRGGEHSRQGQSGESKSLWLCPWAVLCRPLSISPIPAFWLIINYSVPLHSSWHNRLTPLKLQAKIHLHSWVSLYLVTKIRYIIHRLALINISGETGLFNVIWQKINGVKIEAKSMKQ